VTEVAVATVPLAGGAKVKNTKHYECTAMHDPSHPASITVARYYSRICLLVALVPVIDFAVKSHGNTDAAAIQFNTM